MYFIDHVKFMGYFY